MTKDQRSQLEQVARKWILENMGQSGSAKEYSLLHLLATQRAAVLEEVATMLDESAREVLTEWESDKQCPDAMHDPQDCNERCDGYSICHNTFVLVADKLKKQAQEARP